MTPRAWRQLLVEAKHPRTAVQDSILRMALGMWAADLHSSATLTQRAWVAGRLQVTEPDWQRFSTKERAWMKEKLLAYCETQRPELLDVVRKQFTDQQEEACP